MKIIERTHNIQTGEIVDVEREETKQEATAREANEKEFAKQELESKAKATAKAEILTKLGITAEEAALLLS
jgi:hypothetical protein